MDAEMKIKEICDIQSTLISCFKSQIDSGLMNVDTEEAGAVADIIKDLAETEKNLRESKYYETVTKAMEEKQENPYMMGYKPEFDPDRYFMGYNPNHGMNGQFTSKSMGYKPMVDQEPYIDAYLDEYGKSYRDYMNAKKHYTETGSMNEKSRMDMNAKKYITQVLDTMEEIWDDATPELKQRMLTDLKAFTTGKA